MIKAIFSILIGITITVVLCLASALLITEALNLNKFWFWFSFVWSFVIITFSSRVINTTRDRILMVARAEELAEANKYQIVQNIECYKCKGLNDVPMIVSQSNIFNCSTCDAANKILFAVKTCSSAEQATTFNLDAEILVGNVTG